MQIKNRNNFIFRKRGRKIMVKIFSDTSSLYKKGENDDITIIPLNVTINSNTYSEFTDIDSKKFVELINYRNHHNRQLKTTLMNMTSAVMMRY